jgi:hypothetical protein
MVAMLLAHAFKRRKMIEGNFVHPQCQEEYMDKIEVGSCSKVHFGFNLFQVCIASKPSLCVAKIAKGPIGGAGGKWVTLSVLLAKVVKNRPNLVKFSENRQGSGRPKFGSH